MFPQNNPPALQSISPVTVVDGDNYTVRSTDSGKILAFKTTCTLYFPRSYDFPEGFQVAIWNLNESATEVGFNATIVCTGTKLAAKKACTAVIMNGKWYVAGGVS